MTKDEIIKETKDVIDNLRKVQVGIEKLYMSTDKVEIASDCGLVETYRKTTACFVYMKEYLLELEKKQEQEMEKEPLPQVNWEFRRKTKEALRKFYEEEWDNDDSQQV
jgi:hypothetical protein